MSQNGFYLTNIGQGNCCLCIAIFEETYVYYAIYMSQCDFSLHCEFVNQYPPSFPTPEIGNWPGTYKFLRLTMQSAWDSLVGS